jgi:hypothetical protein
LPPDVLLPVIVMLVHPWQSMLLSANARMVLFSMRPLRPFPLEIPCDAAGAGLMQLTVLPRQSYRLMSVSPRKMIPQLQRSTSLSSTRTESASAT